MKNVLILLVWSLFLIACKPEPQVEKVMQSETNVNGNEQKNTQVKEHVAEVRLTVPDSTWGIQIVNVTQTDNEIAVICELIQSDMMGLMVISEVADAVKFTANDLPISYYIKGKTWDWENQETVTFMDADSNFTIQNGEPISFIKTEPSQKGGPKRQSIGTPL